MQIGTFLIGVKVHIMKVFLSSDDFYNIESKYRVLVTGVFDLFHYGHVNLFRRVKKYNNFLVVGVSTDEDTTIHKRKPIFSYRERCDLVSNCVYTDEVIMTPHIITKEYMDEHKVDFVVCGKEDSMRGCFEYPLNNGRLVELDRTPGISTTKLLSEVSNYASDDNRW